ncbi:MAG: outer membrane lipoprotein-sorting protein [Deltaproteobacteria bacterium]|nr:outer membrane lipoprotein-sorting protein [Deltaproteobacteria bacterium]
MRSKHSQSALAALAALALALGFVATSRSEDPVRIAPFCSDTTRSWSAEADVTTYREGGKVETAAWSIAIERTPSGETRTFRVTTGKNEGDVYTAKRSGIGTTATVARDYTRTKPGKTASLESLDADDLFANTVFSFRDLDGGYEDWPVVSVLTSARVEGRPVTTIEAARAPDAPKRLGSWRFDVLASGIAIRTERFDKKGRAMREVRLGNFAEVDGATVAHKWEAKDFGDRSRTVVNLRDIRFTGGAP